MSAINLSGNASGSGTFTIASPNSNTSYTLALPEEAGTITTSNSPYSTFRNRILNGNMVLDQRNAGASVNGDNNYTLDRWQALVSASSKFTVQQNAGSVTPPAGFTNYLGVTSSSAYSVSSGDYFTINQRIEGFNVADLGWGTANAKTVTLSFWVRSSLTGTFGGSFRNSASNRSYPYTYTISAANTWEYKTITVAGDTSGTWLATNGIGIDINFSLGAGATFSGTASAWAGANYFSATGATSVVGTNGATWYITGVQLEVGSVATPFERRPYGTELSLCQRYFTKVGPKQTSGQSYVAVGLMYGTSGGVAVGFLPVTMRVEPTASILTGSAGNFSYTQGNASAVCTSVAFPRTGVNQYTVEPTVSGTPFTLNVAAIFYTDTTGSLGFSAEL